MLTIQKFKDEMGYFDFKITTDDGSFKILFGGNLDLYWSYYGEDMFDIDKKTFRITQDNLYFYNLINELYNKIKDYNVFDNEKLNEDLKKTDKYNTQKLFQNDKVEWHSDDYIYEESAILEIEKLDDEYIITFHKGKVDYCDNVFSIRFRNSGSTYQPFNVLFMDMYKKLIEYDPKFHQIHIEEYMNELKRIRKKETQ